MSGQHATSSGRQVDNLAMAYQEMLTVITRLRSGRQDVSDPALFRSRVMSSLKVAEDEAAQKGYTNENIRAATFAVVGFLDESILNSGNASLAEWLRRPLQHEIFGVQIAGEIFFRNIDRLLTTADSQQLADLLEIYALCLLLGFRGRFGVNDAGNLRAYNASLTEKIARIRGRSWPFSLDWAPQSESLARVSGPSWHGFAWTAAALWIIAILLFAGYKVVLSSGVTATGVPAHL
jgi:type VI secretion system protein ImpK